MHGVNKPQPTLGQPPGPTTPGLINFRKVPGFFHSLGRRGPTIAALVAYGVHIGERSVTLLPTRKAAALFDVPERDLLLLHRAAEFEFSALRRGDGSIEDLRQGQRKRRQDDLTDADLDRITARVGPERMFDAAVRGCQPPAVAAA